MKSICPHYIHLPSCTEWFLCTLPHCTPSEKQLLMNRFTIRRQTDPALLPLLRVPSFRRHSPVQQKLFLLNHVVASKTQTQGAPSKMTKANCIAQLSLNTQHGGSERTSTPGIISVPHEDLGFERLWAPEGICYPFHPATYTCLLHSPPTSAPRSALCTREKQNQLERIQFHLNPSFCQRTRKGRTT